MPKLLGNTIYIFSFSICLNLFLTSCNLLTIDKQQDNSPSNSAVVKDIESIPERNNYAPLDLTQLPADLPQKGTNPKELALTAFGTEQGEGFFQEEVEVYTHNPNQTIVTIKQTNLPDDSVNSIRYRIDFVNSNSQWQMEWAGQQFICQPGRGNQDWSKEICY